MSPMNGVMGHLEAQYKTLKQTYEAVLLENERLRVENNRAVFVLEYEDLEELGFDASAISEAQLMELKNMLFRHFEDEIREAIGNFASEMNLREF